MQQRVKDAFPEALINTDPFTKEIYKRVRNNAKKLDDITTIEDRIKNKQSVTVEQHEKLTKKQELSLQTNSLLESFDIYKKLAVKPQAAPEKVKEVVVEESKEQTQTAKEPAAILQRENKVVECSILTQKQTSSKETQSTQPKEIKTEEAPVQPQIQQVKIVVKDHTSQEETLRLAAGVFQLGLNSHNISIFMSQHPQVINYEDIAAFNQFYFQMLYAQQPMSIATQIESTVQELQKLYVADDSLLVKNFAKPLSYADLRRIFDSLLSNQELQKHCLLNQFMLSAAQSQQVQPETQAPQIDKQSLKEQEESHPVQDVQDEYDAEDNQIEEGYNVDENQDDYDEEAEEAEEPHHDEEEVQPEQEQTPEVQTEEQKVETTQVVEEEKVPTEERKPVDHYQKRRGRGGYYGHNYEHNEDYYPSRGGNYYRGRGNYRGYTRGGYRPQYQRKDQDGTTEEQTEHAAPTRGYYKKPYYEKPYYNKPRDHYYKEHSTQEYVDPLKLDMATGGFEIVQTRGEKKTTAPYTTGHGPRVSNRGGAFRGNRGHYARGGHQE